MQRELLDKLAALEALESDKKLSAKDFSEQIKALKEDVKFLRAGLEAERLETAE